MRLYLLLLHGILVSAVLYELPETLRLVFVDNINPLTDWFLDAGSALGELVALVLPLKSSDLIVLIQNDGNVLDIIRIGEIHVAIGFRVVDPQTVVVVDFVALLLVGAVRNNLEDDLAGQIFGEL